MANVTKATMQFLNNEFGLKRVNLEFAMDDYGYPSDIPLCYTTLTKKLENISEEYLQETVGKYLQEETQKPGIYHFEDLPGLHVFGVFTTMDSKHLLFTGWVIESETNIEETLQKIKEEVDKIETENAETRNTERKQQKDALMQQKKTLEDLLHKIENNDTFTLQDAYAWENNTSRNESSNKVKRVKNWSQEQVDQWLHKNREVILTKIHNEIKLKNIKLERY